MVTWLPAGFVSGDTKRTCRVDCTVADSVVGVAAAFPLSLREVGDSGV